MDLQHERYIRKLSTSQLVSSLQPTPYATLTSVITNLNITGNDLISLLKLSEFEVIIKIGRGNPHLKQFKALLNHVRTQPQDLFALNPTVRDSHSEIQADVLESQRSKEVASSEQFINSRSNRVSQHPSSKAHINRIQAKLNPTNNVTSFAHTRSQKASNQVHYLKQVEQEICRTTISKSPDEEKPVYVNTPFHQEPFKHGLPAYENINPGVKKKPCPKIKHQLECSKERQQLKASLTKAWNELQVAKTHQDEEVQSNVAEDEDLEKTVYINAQFHSHQDRDENPEDEADDISQDSTDSFDSVGKAEPGLPDVPQLPGRPREVNPNTLVTKIKVKNLNEELQPTSDDNKAHSNVDNQKNDSSPKQSRRSVPSVPVELVSPGPAPGKYSKLPSPILEPPSVPLLNPPLYAIRMIKFFRDITREQGIGILTHKPIGTFLLRPSTTYLAVLMFQGKAGINNMHICHDEQADQFYLPQLPETMNTIRAIKFNEMLELLKYYSSNALSTDGDILLNFEINNIN